MKTKDEIVLKRLKKIQETTELLRNPLYNDFCGSHFWYDIDEKLQIIIKDIEENFKIFKINGAK